MKTDTVSFIFALLIFLYLFFLLIKQYRFLWRAQALKIPRLMGAPILGNYLHIVKNFNFAPEVPFAVYILEALKGYIHIIENTGLVFVSVGTAVFCIVTKAKAVEVLLSSNLEVNKSPEYGYAKTWLGEGLLTSSYSRWKRHRKLLTPTFHFRILEQFLPIIDIQSDTLLGKLKSEVGKPFTIIEKFLNNCALDIICETAMGIKINSQKLDDFPFNTSLQRLNTLLFKRVVSPWLWPEWMFRISPRGMQYAKDVKVVKDYIKKSEALKWIDNFLHNGSFIVLVEGDCSEPEQVFSGELEVVEQVIEERKCAIQFPDDGSEMDSKVPSKRRPFLDLLLLHNLESNSEKLTDQDIEDEVNTFAFAGHETTTSALTWTCYLLGLYPDIQVKVQEELDQVFGIDPGPVTLEDLKQLTYLERVIKESNRLYPTVPLIGRETRDDFVIDGISIPRGTTMFICLPSLHRDPVHFPDPEVFDPDRFMDTNKPPFAYVPFSAGPRNCIGQRFAMLEMKTILCKIFRNFRLTSLDPRDLVLLSAELVSRPSRPIRIKIEPRS